MLPYFGQVWRSRCNEETWFGSVGQVVALAQSVWVGGEGGDGGHLKIIGNQNPTVAPRMGLGDHLVTMRVF